MEDDKKIAVDVEMPHMSCLAESIAGKVTYVPHEWSRRFESSALFNDST